MSKLDGKVDAVFADMDVPHHPGAALLVIDHGEIVCKKCYGLADLEIERPITAETSFYLASISKQFTAMAIIMLAEQGKLSFDDRLPVFFSQFPPWGAEISLRHLLHHTSGLPHYIQFFSLSEDVSEFTREIGGITNEAVLERTMELAGPKFPVGAQYAYGGVGYVLLAMIVEIVSGQSFADFLKANVFDPLGMKNTVVYDASCPTRHQLAHGYWLEREQFRRWNYPLLTVGDGGLFSTLDDLFLWDRALNTDRLVSEAALKQAFTSGTTNDGTSVGYGLGWITNVLPYCKDAEREQLLGLADAMRHVAHGGSCVAYNNYIIRFLDTQRTILILTNYPGVPGPRIRAHQVAGILFGN
jgi:CubicO group peptidase (beta-lactamase class C family)